MPRTRSQRLLGGLLNVPDLGFGVCPAWSVVSCHRTVRGGHFHHWELVDSALKVLHGLIHGGHDVGHGWERRCRGFGPRPRLLMTAMAGSPSDVLWRRLNLGRGARGNTIGRPFGECSPTQTPSHPHPDHHRQYRDGDHHVRVAMEPLENRRHPMDLHRSAKKAQPEQDFQRVFEIPVHRRSDVATG